MITGKKSPAILVMLLASSTRKERLKAVLETWARRVRKPHKLFILGDIHVCTEIDLEGHTCFFSKYTDYKSIVQRLGAFMASIDSSLQFTHIYKCDDDTYVNFDNLIDFVIDHFDKNAIIGSKIGNIKNSVKYPQGGAGYLFNRKVFEKIGLSHYNISVNQQTYTIYESNPEDYAIGLAAQWEGVEILNFNYHFKFYPKPIQVDHIIANKWLATNDKISLHPVKNSSLMYEIDRNIELN